LHAAEVTELDPLLDRALPERRLADQLGSPAILEPATDYLAGGRRSLVDQEDELDLGVRGDAAARGVGLGLNTVRVLAPHDRARGDEIAGDVGRVGDEPAR